jgi:hypothetical protein
MYYCKAINRHYIYSGVLNNLRIILNLRRKDQNWDFGSLSREMLVFNTNLIRFRLYHDGPFYWQTKPHFPEKTHH